MHRTAPLRVADGTLDWSWGAAPAPRFPAENAPRAKPLPRLRPVSCLRGALTYSADLEDRTLALLRRKPARRAKGRNESGVAPIRRCEPQRRRGRKGQGRAAGTPRCATGFGESFERRRPNPPRPLRLRGFLSNFRRRSARRSAGSGLGVWGGASRSGNFEQLIGSTDKVDDRTSVQVVFCSRCKG
jgi:hypothetical protein